MGAGRGAGGGGERGRAEAAHHRAMMLEVQNANLKSMLIGEPSDFHPSDDFTIDPLVANMFGGGGGAQQQQQQQHGPPQAQHGEKDPDAVWVGAAGVGFHLPHQELGQLWMTAEDLDTSNDALLHPPLA